MSQEVDNLGVSLGEGWWWSEASIVGCHSKVLDEHDILRFHPGKLEFLPEVFVERGASEIVRWHDRCAGSVVLDRVFHSGFQQLELGAQIFFLDTVGGGYGGRS